MLKATWVTRHKHFLGLCQEISAKLSGYQGGNVYIDAPGVHDVIIDLVIDRYKSEWFISYDGDAEFFVINKEKVNYDKNYEVLDFRIREFLDLNIDSDVPICFRISDRPPQASIDKAIREYTNRGWTVKQEGSNLFFS